MAQSQSIKCFVCKCVQQCEHVNVIISCRSFVSGQSRAKVSAGLTDVSSLAVAAFDFVYCSRFVSFLDVSKSSHRKVVLGLCATRI